MEQIHPTNQRHTSISWYGEERIMGVAEAVMNVVNSVFAYRDRMSMITSLVIPFIVVLSFTSGIHSTSTMITDIPLSSHPPSNRVFYTPLSFNSTLLLL